MHSAHEFIRHKETRVKYLRNPDGSRVPVASLPQLAPFSLSGSIEVKCEYCETWHPCVRMHPVQTGLECSACHAKPAAQKAAPGTSETEHAAAMRKAASLLRLAQSDNPHEAALAAERAQEIINRYKLNAATLNSDTPSHEPAEEIRDYKDDPLAGPGGTWRAFLAQALADVNQCKVYTLSGSVCIIGRASDVAMVRPFFNHLVAEVERLAEKHCKGNSRTYWNNFRLGAVETISQRLRQSLTLTVQTVKAEAAGNAAALAVVENSLARIEKRKEEVSTWVRLNKNLRTRSHSCRHSEGGREAGRTAGHSVNLGRSAGALNSGTRALK